MIKKLKAYDIYPTAPLPTVLDSEWDVLSALHRELQRFRTYPKINWVKSHQDEKVYDKQEMPLDAYLNSFQAKVPYMGPEKGSFFTGVYLPQKSVLPPPIERQYKPFQKHVSSY
jgi:hypothetical protein